MRVVVLVLTATLGLAACGPIPVEKAEAACLNDALLAEHPRGTVGVGVNQKGEVFPYGEVTISTDFIAGRDPSDVFNSCVKRRSGQFPSRPLYDQPGWR